MTKKQGPQNKEQQALVKKIMMLSGLLFSMTGCAGLIFHDVAADFLGDKDTAYILCGTMIFAGIIEIVTSKILFREANTR